MHALHLIACSCINFACHKLFDAVSVILFGALKTNSVARAHVKAFRGREVLLTLPPTQRHDYTISYCNHCHCSFAVVALATCFLHSQTLRVAYRQTAFETRCTYCFKVGFCSYCQEIQYCKARRGYDCGVWRDQTYHQKRSDCVYQRPSELDIMRIWRLSYCIGCAHYWCSRTKRTRKGLHPFCWKCTIGKWQVLLIGVNIHPC